MDKREGERVPILGDLPGEIMVFQPMVLREISLGGATLETRAPLHLNSLHDLRLTLGGTSIIVKGRVVHSRISDVDQDIVTYRTGVEFIELSERVQTAIALFIDEIEGYRPSQPDRSLYTRVLTDVTLADGRSAKAWAYFYNAPLGQAQRIDSGDYLEHLNGK